MHGLKIGAIVSLIALFAGLPSRAAISPIQDSGITPIARDMAVQLNVLPIMEQLDQYKASTEFDAKKEIEALKLKQQLMYRVSVAQLQVRDATARIEREVAYINRLRGVLEDKRDRAIKLNSIENVVASGGLSEIANARSFAINQGPNNIVNMTAGAATIALGGWALKEQSGASHKMDAKPNMLAEVFKVPCDDNSKYPAFVWENLNRPAVGANRTRLQLLFERWEKFGVIPRHLDTAAGKKRVAVLTNTIQNGRANIDVFDDRTDMLMDLRAEIFQADRDLLELMTCLQSLYQ